MKLLKLIVISILLSSVVLLYSCESNDSNIVHGTGNLKAKSKMLIEVFTNTSCVGCPAADAYVDQIHHYQGVTINDTNVIIIKVHTTMFPNDPFYLFNVPVNNTRQTYYGAGIVNPLGFSDGTMMAVPFSSSAWTNQINQHLNLTRTFAINLSNTYNSANNTGTINLQLGQLSGATVSDLRYFIAVVEDDLHYNAPNGVNLHNSVLRDMLTAPAGDDLQLSAGQSVNISKDYSLKNGINYLNTSLVVFIQSVSTKTVYAVEKIKLQ